MSKYVLPIGEQEWQLFLSQSQLIASYHDNNRKVIWCSGKSTEVSYASSYPTLTSYCINSHFVIFNTCNVRYSVALYNEQIQCNIIWYNRLKGDRYFNLRVIAYFKLVSKWKWMMYFKVFVNPVKNNIMKKIKY